MGTQTWVNNLSTTISAALTAGFTESTSAATGAASVTLATSAAQGAAGTGLTFTSTAGVAVGQLVTGTSIPANTTVAAVTSTTVTLSASTTAAVASSASIVFKAAVSIPTSAAQGAAGTGLTFTSTAGVIAGQLVSGSSIPAGTYVASVTSTTVTLSQSTTAIVASGATISFSGAVLSLGSATGVVVGMGASGTGVAAGSTVGYISGTTVTLSANSTTGIASGATITFGGQTTLSVPSGVAAILNAAGLSAAKPAIMTLTQASPPESSWEVVAITAATSGSPDTLTVTRAYETTPSVSANGAGLAWASGSKLEMRVTAGAQTAFPTLATSASGGGAFAIQRPDGKPFSLVNTPAWFPTAMSSGGRAVMASPPTVTQGTTATLTGRVWGVGVDQGVGTFVNNATDYSVIRGSLAGANQAGTFNRACIFPNNITLSGTPTGLTSVAVIHDGQNIEASFLNFGASTFPLYFKVNDLYVSATPTAVTTNGSTAYVKLAFSGRAPRRIDVLCGAGVKFSGFNTDANDTITAAPVRGKRLIVFGDSFVAGAGGNQGGAAGTFPYYLADYLGWDDVWASGAGGEGMTVAGTAALPLPARYATDVAPYNPDVVIHQASVNDRLTNTYQTLYAAAYAQFSTAKQLNPNTLHIALGMPCNGGPFVQASTLATTRNSAGLASFWDLNYAIRDAASAAGIYFFNLAEQPLNLPYGQTVVSTTLSAAAAANFGTIQTASNVGGLFANNSTIEIGTPSTGFPINSFGSSTRVRALIKSQSGVGPITYTLDTPATHPYTFPVGTPVTLVGNSFWSGNGLIGTTSGFGNSDLYLYSDGLHPTDACHAALGALLGRLIQSVI